MPLYGLVSALLVAIAAIVAVVVRARSQVAQAAAAAAAALADRQRAVDVLQGTVRDQSARIRDLDVQLRELDTVRSTRAALSAELDRTRQALAIATDTANKAEEAARSAVERLQTENTVEEKTAAADRAIHDAELRSARQAVESMRRELAADRDANVRAMRTVEEERDRTRAALETELAAARSALRRVEAEWVGVQSETAELRHDAEVRRRELEAERRNAAAAEASLRAELATMREGVTAIAAEREGLGRELAVQRARAVSAEQTLYQLRADGAARLAAEHRRAMDLVSRIWSYARPGEPAPIPDADGGRRTDEASAAAPTPPAPTPVVAAPETPEPEQPVAATAPAPVAPAPVAPAPAAPAPAAPAPAAQPPSQSRPAAPVTYDVERPLSQPTAGPADLAPRPSETLADPGDDTPEPAPARATGGNGRRRLPSAPADVALTVHTLPPHLRKPVAVLREDGDGGALILCNDGSLWELAATGSWREASPVPGSQREVVKHFYEEMDAPGRAVE